LRRDWENLQLKRLSIIVAELLRFGEGVRLLFATAAFLNSFIVPCCIPPGPVLEYLVAIRACQCQVWPFFNPGTVIPTFAQSLDAPFLRLCGENQLDFLKKEAFSHILLKFRIKYRDFFKLLEKCNAYSKK
jgi:hypothetical protein